MSCDCHCSLSLEFALKVVQQLDRIEGKLDTMALNLDALTNTMNNLVSIANTAVSELQGLTADIAKLQAANTDATNQPLIDALQTRAQSAVDALTTGIANNPVPVV